MLVFIAKLLAHALFAFTRPFVFVRHNRTLMSLFTVTAVATILATLGATLIDRRPLMVENGDASALGSFISANGTTTADWQISGPKGPGLYEGDAGGVLIELEGGANLIADFGDTPATLSLSPGVSLAGAAGAGNVSLGSMTGATTLPTGSLSWIATSGNRLTFEGHATGPFHSLIEDVGSGIVLAANSGTAEITGSNTLITGTTTIYFGSNGSVNPILDIVPTFQPQTNAGSTVYACGTGGTQVLDGAEFGVIVTTGTLSSNCVLNFATNDSTGFFVIDMSGVTLNATFGVEFENGSATKTYTTATHTSGSTQAEVWTHGTNTLSVLY
jgi:hypothetical protein